MLKSRVTIFELNSEWLYDRPKSYLVLKNEASDYLREKKRICSRKIGTWQHHQSAEIFLPLQLSNEEICLLIDLFGNETKIVKSIFSELKNFKNKVDLHQLKSKYDCYLAELNSKQIESFKTNRKKQMIAKKNQILNGKRKKFLEELDKIEKKKKDQEINQEEKDNLNQQKNSIEYNLNNLELIFEQELNNVDQSDSFFNEIEIFHSTPEFYNSFFKIEEIPIEDFKTLNRKLFINCKYSAFKYLYIKGFYLTSGAKFGGDFLVYPGDPTNYHSQFILVCFDSKQEYNSLSLKQLVTYARMATTVKKTFLISFLSEERLALGCLSINLDDKRFLNFLSINWSHI